MLHDELKVLLKPWLPDAEIEPGECQVWESCGCYSEYTTDSPGFSVEVIATLPVQESEQIILRDVIEEIVTQYMKSHYDFVGCSCCQGDEYEDGDPAHSISNYICLRAKV